MYINDKISYPVVVKSKSPRSHVILKNGNVEFTFPFIFDILENDMSPLATCFDAG